MAKLKLTFHQRKLGITEGDSRVRKSFTEMIRWVSVVFNDFFLSPEKNNGKANQPKRLLGKQMDIVSTQYFK